MTSAYHPELDGQTEVLNRVIEQYLQSFVHHQPTSWEKFIIWAEWSYNTFFHSATGLTPFEVTFGKKAPSISQYLTETSNIDVVDDFLVNHDTTFAMLKKKLLTA